MITITSKAHLFYPIARSYHGGRYLVLAFYGSTNGSIQVRNELAYRINPCSGDGSIWHNRVDGVLVDTSTIVTTGPYSGYEVAFYWQGITAYYYSDIISTGNSVMYTTCSWYKYEKLYRWSRSSYTIKSGMGSSSVIYLKVDEHTWSNDPYTAGAEPAEWIVDSASTRTCTLQSFDMQHMSQSYPNCMSLYQHHELEQIWYCSVGWGLISSLMQSCQVAFVNAMEHVPKAHVNTIANILEVVWAIRRLHDGDLTTLQGLKGVLDSPSTGSDIWLQYRYRLGTSLSDSKEYYSLFKRLKELTNSQTKSLECYGYAMLGTSLVRCNITCTFSSAYCDSLSDALSIGGVDLNLANAWDLIPYSFVVDWFAHIGDWLEKVDTELSFGDERYSISMPCFSVSTVASGLPVGLTGSTYCRFFAPMRTLMGYCWYDDSSPTKTLTIIRRIFDGFSLILQRL